MSRYVLYFVALALVPVPVQGQLASFDASGMTFGHVHLNVSDLDTHRELWTEQFGGVVVERGFLTAVRFPGMVLVLTEQPPTGPSQGSVMDHFGFKVRDLDRQLERWKAAGYEVQAEITGAEGFPNAYLLGPDGVRIELQEDTEQELDVVAHHIHFFTPEYEELLDWYVEMFGLERYERGTIATTANAPGMNLSFNGVQEPRAPTRGRVIDHIGFEFEDLESVAEELEARGIVFDVPYREIPAIGLGVAFFTDPAGVYVELTEGLVDY